jgi:hypothetical protein
MFGKKKRNDPPATPPILRCSFCNKTQLDVLKLVAGPNVNICNECIDICVDILRDARKDQPQPGSERLPEDEQSWARSSTWACALCRIPVAVAEATVVENRGLICPGCRGEIEAAIARETVPS